MSGSGNQMDDKEVQRHFASAVKAALNTPPSPREDVSSKHVVSKAKRKARGN